MDEGGGAFSNSDSLYTGKGNCTYMYIYHVLTEHKLKIILITLHDFLVKVVTCDIKLRIHYEKNSSTFN